MMTWRVIWCVLAVAVAAKAQQAPPATGPTTRRVTVVPAGYERISVARRDVICRAQDEKWVRAAVDTTKAATRPSTGPSELIERVGATRKQITAEVMADLGLTDAKAIDEMYDKNMLPSLRALAALRPPIIYLVTTREGLKDAVLGGWQDPHFYYNRAAGEVQIDDRIAFSAEGPMDDSVQAVLYDAKMTEAQRGALLSKRIASDEAGVSASIAARGMVLSRAALVRMVDSAAIVPLKLKRDQAWMGLGVVSVLTAKYSAEVTGVAREQLMMLLTYQSPRSPVQAAHVDLLHPTAPEDLRPEYAPFYADAMRVKSTRVIAAWLGKVGDRTIAKVLTAIMQKKPADGVALAGIVKEVSGVDLNGELSPQ